VSRQEARLELPEAVQVKADSARDFSFVLPTVKRLSVVSRYRALGDVLFDWSVILLLAAVVEHHFAWWAYLLSLPIISGRQHALGVLMHDASHYRLFPNRALNDLLSNWVLAYPLLVTTEGYRRNHLSHHAFLNTDKDPDWSWKRDKPDWQFPKTPWGLFVVLAKVGLGGGLLYHLVRMKKYGAPRALNHSQYLSSKSTRIVRMAFYFTAVALITWAGAWRIVGLYWLLPLATLTPVVLRIRSISEHFGLDGKSDLSMSRTTLIGLVERTLFAPHHINYHLEHHLFPSVPHYNLPKLHATLMHLEFYRAESHRTRGIWGMRADSLWGELTRKSD
jgi:fatty acid desaturase